MRDARAAGGNTSTAAPGRLPSRTAATRGSKDTSTQSDANAWTTTIGVSVAWTDDAIRLEAIDDDPLVPTRHDAEPGDVDGCGLAVLERLGRRRADRRPAGEVVWAEIPIH